MSVPNRCVNLVATQLLTTESIWPRLAVSMGKDTDSTILMASARACVRVCVRAGACVGG